MDSESTRPGRKGPPAAWEPQDAIVGRQVQHDILQYRQQLATVTLHSAPNRALPSVALTRQRRVAGARSQWELRHPWPQYGPEGRCSADSDLTANCVLPRSSARTRTPV